MPGAGCAGSPEPCGAQSVLVALGGAVVPRPHRSVPVLCRDHRGPGKSPELPWCRGDRVGGFFSGGGPSDTLLVNKSSRQRQTSGPGEQMWSLCMCFVLERKRKQLGVAWVCALPAQECGPQGWGSWTRKWSSAQSSAGVNSFQLPVGREMGRCLQGLWNCVWLILFLLAKYLWNNRYINVSSVCWDGSAAYSWQSVMSHLSPF